ncbi:MAG: polysaccharide deacetylase family protein [Candidatus Methanomethylophilaceae archaeon]|nr:polysaccharide deacetylase family protein [Candidatus Methanomethylophilaceae archaeon]
MDLDRDANLAVQGSAAAGSMDRGNGTAPRFSSAERGLSILLDILDELGMKATFFVEGRTAETIDCSCLSGHCIGLHGYDHEDLTGESTGVPMPPSAVSEALEKGFCAVSDAVSRPVCFRAPYMACDDAVLRAVSGLGILHDSSFYSDGPKGPYATSYGITEHPVPRGRDAAGKTIAAYLWPMHEGRRPPEDYIRFAGTAEGDFVLADHTWHMVESRGGIMDAGTASENAARTASVLRGILDLGFEPAILLRRLGGLSGRRPGPARRWGRKRRGLGWKSHNCSMRISSVIGIIPPIYTRASNHSGHQQRGSKLDEIRATPGSRMRLRLCPEDIARPILDS